MANQLYSAFIDGNFEKFVEALEIYDLDPNSLIDSKNQSVFELILQTPHSSNYIKKCIEHGADFHVRGCNDLYPLHYVVQSACLENLNAVEKLITSTVKATNPSFANVKDRSGNNCIHMLITMLSNDNFEEIFSMIKILIQHGCNSSYQNDDERTPFSILLAKSPDLERGQEIIEYFTEHAKEDLLNCKNQELLSENEMKLKQKASNFENMSDLLKSSDSNPFECNFQTFRRNCSSLEIFRDNCAYFLEIAIEKSLISVADLLLSQDIDVNKISTSSKMELPPLFLACKFSNFGTFKSLLANPHCNWYFHSSKNYKTLLHQFIDEFKSKSNVNFVYRRELTINERKCFDLLINNPKITRDFINTLDVDGYSVLHYTVRHGLDYMTLKLLEKGAYIGTVINHIRKDLLNDFLDNCITCDDKYHDDEYFKIFMDQQFLIPSEVQHEMESRLKCYSNNIDVSVDSTIISEISIERTESFVKEMEVMMKLADNKERRELLLHPVLSTFVHLKWSKVKLLAYTNLALILFFTFTFIPMISLQNCFLVNLKGIKDYDIVVGMIMILVPCGSLLMLFIKELLLFLVSPKKYLIQISSYINLSLLLTSFILLLDIIGDDYTVRIVRALMIMLTALVYFMQLEILPLHIISMSSKIFRKVFFIFAKIFIFYSLIIFGFVLSIQALNGRNFAESNKLNNSTLPEEMDGNDDNSTLQGTTDHVSSSLAMIVVEINFNLMFSQGFAYKTLFLLFIFTVAIVLYNILNAIAVTIAHEVKQDEKLTDLIQRVKIISNTEDFLYSRDSELSQKLKSSISLFTELKNGKFVLKPGKGNAIYIGPVKILNSSLPKRLRCFSKYLELNSKVIQDIKMFLLKKNEEMMATKIRLYEKKRSEKLAKDISRMYEIISEKSFIE